MKTLIIIITYNEIENIPLLIPQLFETIPPNVDVLVVDDSSPDGTGAAVEELAKKYPGRLHLFTRPVKEGTAKAYLAGFRWGMEKNYDAYLQFDGDFSHNPKYIAAMLEEIKTHDVVVGSRYIKGGHIEDWTLQRKIISRGGSLYSRIILSCPVKDLTGGYNMWRKTALEKINLDGIISKSYSLQIELKYKAFCAGCSIKEVPITFTDRERGVSKISNNTLLEALVNVWKIKKNVNIDGAIDQFLKFAATGGLGAVLNLLIFFLSVDVAGLPPVPVSVALFLLIGLQNYIINHKWSFKQNTGGEPLSFKKWFMFMCGALVGYLANVSAMSFMLWQFELPWKTIAQASGIAVGMFINFAVSRTIVFRKKSDSAATATEKKEKQ
ncbi:MAG: glycosyltransferase family 2 protein [Spirochaetes bacterium]|nr:glycosyltransferase family 2 protein [Spirochaetota bacterium]